jgi:hypothetical protein
LVDAAVGQNVLRGPYGKHVCDAARSLVEGYQARAVQNYCRLTNLREYEAEREWRRKIRLTIDPAAAETIFWHPDMNDPYHNGQSGSELFARKCTIGMLFFRCFSQRSRRCRIPVADSKANSVPHRARISDYAALRPALPERWRWWKVIHNFLQKHFVYKKYGFSLHPSTR